MTAFFFFANIERIVRYDLENKKWSADQSGRRIELLFCHWRVVVVVCAVVRAANEAQTKHERQKKTTTEGKKTKNKRRNENSKTRRPSLSFSIRLDPAGGFRRGGGGGVGGQWEGLVVDNRSLSRGSRAIRGFFFFFVRQLLVISYLVLPSFPLPLCCCCCCSCDFNFRFCTEFLV